MNITQDNRVNTGVDYYLQQNPCVAPAQHLLEFVANKARGKRLLDFGCGIGAYSYQLRQKGFETVGVDANLQYVDIAKANGGIAHQITGKVLPFPDKSFDTTFLLEVLEHLPDNVIREVLPEICRVTRFNVLITVPNNTQYQELLIHDLMFGHYQAVDHVQFFTVDNITDLLDKYFTSVEVVQKDPLYPHRLLPPLCRRAMSLLYRLNLVKPILFARLFVEAKI